MRKRQSPRAGRALEQASTCLQSALTQMKNLRNSGVWVWKYQANKREILLIEIQIPERAAGEAPAGTVG